jgi:HlyD family type I secretion membrane fusion protein
MTSIAHIPSAIDRLPRRTELVHGTLPDPIEPLAPQTRTTLMLLLTLVAGLGVAAAVLPIEGAVVGSGQIDVASRIKTVAHPAGGTIADILVHDGQHVRAGQPLIRLDDKVVGTDARVAALSLVQLRARKARLEAEVAGAGGISFPDDLLASADDETRRAVADERNQFGAARAERAALDSQMAARAAQAQQQAAGYGAQIAALRAQATLIRPERDAMKSLFARKLVTVSRYNQIERTSADIEGNIATLTTEIAGARARMAEANGQIAQARAQRRSAAGDQLAQVNDLLGQQRVRNAAAIDARNHAVIRAPYDGVVDKLSVATIGGVVRPAEPLLSIVPDRDPLVVSATISVADVDRVVPGQKVRVRLSALSATTTPELEGKIAWVGASRSTEPQSHQSFYEVRVTLNPRAIPAGVRLRAGMPAEVFVTTGSRSMASFLLKPLADQFARAFRGD